MADQLWLMTRIREEEEEWGASKCHYDDKLADNGVDIHAPRCEENT